MSAAIVQAQTLVTQALQRGTLKRQPCELCGDPAVAHHDDYAQPLAVRWLCRSHHARWHAAHKAAGRDGPGPSGLVYWLSIRLDLETAESLRREAERVDVTVARLIRRFIREGLANGKAA